jgi:hypothetical protein
MKVKSQKDFFAGLMFMVLGALFAWGSTTYSIGTAARMGPGYFPLVLGVLLAILGMAVTFFSLMVATPDGEEIGAFAWRPLIFIIAANLVFGASIGGLPLIGLPPLGMIVGIYLLTLIASHAGTEFNLKEVLVLATILSMLSYFAFGILLKLQFPVWPAFLQA